MIKNNRFGTENIPNLSYVEFTEKLFHERVV